MTTRTDLDRSISAWLVAEAPDRAPDDVLEASRHQLRITRQRRPLWPAGRSVQMSNFTRIAAGLAAVLAIAVGAVTIGPLLDSPNTPAATGPRPSPGGSGAIVVLEPGRYATRQFRPTLTYTVPVGWTVVEDTATSFTLAPAAFTNALLRVCRNPQPGDGQAKPVDGVGTDAKALATWLAGRPDVDVISGPTDWSNGGLNGSWLDLRGVDYVSVIGVTGDSGCGTDMYPDQRIRVGFLDASDATLLVYVWDVFGGDGYIKLATEVIETFAFDAP